MLVEQLNVRYRHAAFVFFLLQALDQLTDFH
jgi:hypothetical protein